MHYLPMYIIFILNNNGKHAVLG